MKPEELDLLSKVIDRVGNTLPTREQIETEAEGRLMPIFHPSFKMGAYYVRLAVLRELQQIIKEETDGIA